MPFCKTIIKISKNCVLFMFEHFFHYHYKCVHKRTYFIEHNRHFLSTYFFVDPFILPY